MVRKSLVFIFAVILIGLIPAVSAAEVQDKIQVSINGENVDFSEITGYPFLDENNCIQVPFKATLEKFGAKVDWLNQIEVAIAEKNGIYIEIPNGKSYILKNGMKIDNESISQSKNGRLYLPIRIVMEQFGCDVKWDSLSQTVLITYIPVKEKDDAADVKQETTKDKQNAVDVKEEDIRDKKDTTKKDKPQTKDSQGGAGYYSIEERESEDYWEAYGTNTKEETEYKKPVITLDQDIPNVTDQASFVVSGTCENTEYISVQSPLNNMRPIKPENNRFSITVKLVTDTDVEAAQKEKGIGNGVTIIARNGDKVLIKDYIVYYN
ncbi:copper amine oxidase N-terminal domain-containing protein [Desulforamulus aeronauticus]|uniref:Copper amine oxidase N-terminal domain-containing protein n=1 Tax=Desulforamulus aeronauticus DSM 10349 TaxID=1121421 RepID=A0A1M6VZ32_9FIRM|nr:copper amine oxidase N-terminal domain-containing protein [Desulforamulus aeronauticus]SHK86596.1 Copper amine oxidase N-terminal domain-containing protein [Desulforamulus aeronauticus DSM 10349]